MREQLNRPPGWNEQPIWAHIDHMWENIQASHYHLVAARERLEAISSIYDDITTDWRDPESRIGAMLFIRALSAYRASVALGMCSPVEMYPVLRLCLECASYAFYMADDYELQTTWLQRGVDEAHLKASRKSFAPEKIREKIKRKNVEIYRIYNQLYEQTIMLGAHPNELIVTSALKTENRVDGSPKIEQIVMLPGVGHSLDVAMITAARVGLCSLLLFQHVHPKRYIELNIDGRIAAARQDL